jgi:hypothetical protein
MFDFGFILLRGAEVSISALFQIRNKGIHHPKGVLAGSRPVPEIST